MSLVRVTSSLGRPTAYRTVVPEDMVDVALRNAKTEEEFDAIYAYSGRPMHDEFGKFARQVLRHYVDDEEAT